MKDKNLPNDYNSLSLEELTKKYQDLLKLNNIIEKKFQKNVKNINEKTKENILEIKSKKNAKRIK
jgi:hypothetical protein